MQPPLLPAGEPDAPAPGATLEHWLAYIESLHPQGQAGIELGLARLNHVKAALDLPPHCPVITVGGTNGKGSTCAYLESILRAAGYRVGCYSSPHLLAYNERVRIDGLPVEDAALVAAFARVDAARRASGETLTYFEFGTLAAWAVFAAARVEVVILEVGLGGRLDAVNAFEPDVAIVTGIALDHTDWLGPDREAIGFEKAGIYRAGKPAFCADPQPPQALLDHAAQLGADLRLLGRDFGYSRSTVNAASADPRLQWQWWCRRADQLVRRNLAWPGLRGPLQLRNASVALAALEALVDRLPVTMQAIRRGLIETELPGRFQVLPGQPVIVLDVAHNPEAVGVLADNLANQGFFPETQAVLGMLADKDAEAALLSLKDRIDCWRLADLPGPRGGKAQALADLIEKAGLGGAIHLYPDPESAFLAAQEAAHESGRIAVFGSFLTVAAALRALRKKP